MSLLTLVQDACNEIGLPEPAAVVGSPDATVKQLLALANSAGEDLVQRGAWQECVKQASFTTIAQEDQGALEGKAPGFNWAVYETMWNRSSQEYVGGPLFPREWQFLKASQVSGPFPEHRIRDKNLHLLPAPAAGDTVAFEYVSRHYSTTSGGAGQERFAADTDLCVLPERIMKRELIWRFKAAKGLAYGEDFRMSEEQVANALARSGGNRTLNLEGCAREYDPRMSVFAPAGNWPL